MVADCGHVAEDCAGVRAIEHRARQLCREWGAAARGHWPPLAWITLTFGELIGASWVGNGPLE